VVSWAPGGRLRRQRATGVRFLLRDAHDFFQRGHASLTRARTLFAQRAHLNSDAAPGGASAPRLA